MILTPEEFEKIATEIEGQDSEWINKYNSNSVIGKTIQNPIRITVIQLTESLTTILGLEFTRAFSLAFNLMKAKALEDGICPPEYNTLPIKPPFSEEEFDKSPLGKGVNELLKNIQT